jgi:alcohol dehydrogenase
LAAAGYDAISHAVESYVTTKRNLLSQRLAREAWRLLEQNYERALKEPTNLEVMGAMQAGAYLGGAAIENSMLGATHACANPLSARYGTTHGVAIALMLSHVVRWNAEAAAEGYNELLEAIGLKPGISGSAHALALRLDELAAAGGLSTRLGAAGVPRGDLPALAEDAGQQWTGKFNPRPFDTAAALEVYQCAY